MIAVTRLGPHDVAAMRALNALFAVAFNAPDGYCPAPDDRWLADTLAKSHVIVLLATLGETPVGGLVAYELDKLEQARREYYIYDLAVTAEHHRRGVATALISHLRDHAASRGSRVIFVQADHGDDPAVALYTKLGTREDVMHFDIAVPRDD